MNELTNHEFRCWFFQYLWGVWPKAICTIEARVPFQCHSWPKPLHPYKCLEVRWWNRSNRIGGAPAWNIGQFSKLWRKGWIYLIMLIQQYFTNLRSKHMLASLLYIFTIFQFLKNPFWWDIDRKVQKAACLTYLDQREFGLNEWFAWNRRDIVTVGWFCIEPGISFCIVMQLLDFSQHFK